MENKDIYAVNDSTGSWITCPKCGILYQGTHVCGNNLMTETYWTNFHFQVFQEILFELKQINLALEYIKGKLK